MTKEVGKSEASGEKAKREAESYSPAKTKSVADVASRQSSPAKSKPEATKPPPKKDEKPKVM